MVYVAWWHHRGLIRYSRHVYRLEFGSYMIQQNRFSLDGGVCTMSKVKDTHSSCGLKARVTVSCHREAVIGVFMWLLVAEPTK